MDEIDRAQEREQQDRQFSIANAAKPLEPGTEGECELCGEWSGRIVRGACAPCRDRYRLP